MDQKIAMYSIKKAIEIKKKLEKFIDESPLSMWDNDIKPDRVEVVYFGTADEVDVDQMFDDDIDEIGASNQKFDVHIITDLDGVDTINRNANEFCKKYNLQLDK